MFNFKAREEQYIEDCRLQKTLNIKTVKAYLADLNQFFDHFGGDLTRETIKSYISWLHEYFKPRTAKRKIASLKAFVHYLINEDILDTDPFSRIETAFMEPDVLPRVMSKSTVSRILAEVHHAIERAPSEFKRQMAMRDAALLEILFATGARVSEICNLLSNSVDLGEHTLRIYGKGSKERILYIENSEVLKSLRAYQSCFRDSISASGYFFVNKLQGHLSERAVRDIINKYVNLAGIDQHVTPHMFRHTFATMLLEADVDIRYIQRMLGHSSITTTQIYTHVALAKQKEILSAKHPRNTMKLC